MRSESGSAEPFSPIGRAASALCAEAVLSPEGFAAKLDSDLNGVLDDLVAMYVHGSVALGGFVAGRSDIDVLVVADQARGRDDLAVAAQAVHALAGQAPGRGVELSVVTSGAARAPSPPWPFLLHVTTAAPDAKTVFGDGHAGDPDLLMHYVVCRAAAIVIRGPDPESLIGEVDRADVLDYLGAELRWALEHAPEAYGVLNACRALAYLENSFVVSKIDGAQYALDRGGPVALINESLSMQQVTGADRSPSREARAFINGVEQLLAARAR